MKKILFVGFVLGAFLLGSSISIATAKWLWFIQGSNRGKAYAGSEKCKACHKAQYNSWKNTIHAWMVRPIAKGDLKNAKADLTLENAPKPDQYDWAYVIGGWYKEERYTFWDEKGNIIDGEFEYNKPRKHFSIRKTKEGALSRLDWFNECGNCHATGVNYKDRTLLNSTSVVRLVMGLPLPMPKARRP
jgi:hypothetical protein